MFGDVAYIFACLSVVDDGAARDLDNLILSVLAEALVLASRLTVTGKGMTVVAQVEQRPVVAVTAQNDMASSSAIAPVGTSVRTILLTPHVGRSSTTLTRAAVYLYIINKV
jgi:hypothetical protein